jgi:hypothetical protein
LESQDLPEDLKEFTIFDATPPCIKQTKQKLFNKQLKIDIDFFSSFQSHDHGLLATGRPPSVRKSTNLPNKVSPPLRSLGSWTQSGG